MSFDPISKEHLLIFKQLNTSDKPLTLSVNLFVWDYNFELGFPSTMQLSANGFYNCFSQVIFKIISFSPLAPPLFHLLGKIIGDSIQLHFMMLCRSQYHLLSWSQNQPHCIGIDNLILLRRMAINLTEFSQNMIKSWLLIL